MNPGLVADDTRYGFQRCGAGRPLKIGFLPIIVHGTDVCCMFSRTVVLVFELFVSQCIVNYVQVHAQVVTRICSNAQTRRDLKRVVANLCSDLSLSLTLARLTQGLP